MTVLALPSRVDIREVGPRDGLQIEAPISTEAKAELLRALAATGARRIEATAFVSRSAVPAMADAEAVAAVVDDIGGGIEWSALVVGPGGADRAVAAGMTAIEYVVSAADGHSLANARRTTDEAVAAVERIAGTAQAAGGRCEVIVATAFDCPFDGRVDESRVLDVARRAVDAGADAICLADTIGTATPTRVTDLVGLVGGDLPGVDVGVHLHNTRGTGIANALAALIAGVTRLDASIGGLGGCPFAPGASGNIATEELVYLLDGAGVEHGIDLSRALQAAELARRLVGHELDSSLLRAGGPSVPRGRPAS